MRSAKVAVKLLGVALCAAAFLGLPGGIHGHAKACDRVQAFSQVFSAPANVYAQQQVLFVPVPTYSYGVPVQTFFREPVGVAGGAVANVNVDLGRRGFFGRRRGPVIQAQAIGGVGGSVANVNVFGRRRR